MTKLHNVFKTTRLFIWLLLCVLILAATSVYAAGNERPFAAVDILGSPDAAVNGKFAVGTSTPGNKALTVAGVIDFVGAGTVHNYFTQGPGNNMQIRSNVDEYNGVGNSSYAQWNMVMGASLDVFSIRRSPASATYNEDALFWIEGSTGHIGIAKVDTSNGATIPFTLMAQLHVENDTGDGIWGVTAAASGTTSGVYGRSDSDNGNGVYGFTTATTGYGYGVLGVSNSDLGLGVFGLSEATSGYSVGLWGESKSTDGSGAVGLALATSGEAFGVEGVTYSTEGVGLWGYADATTGVTVGVYGGVVSTSGYAGYFDGDVQVVGTLSKSAGSFKIDHPLDPENKYLYHSFVESPDMKNIYDGVVVLDENGTARVQLPDWFEALNQDFRYQLTPIGSWAPLYIAQEIHDNAFQIAGGDPGMKVAWMVTGIRHDPYAEDNRIPVEEEKEGQSQGTYLYPQGYGQPDTLSGSLSVERFGRHTHETRERMR